MASTVYISCLIGSLRRATPATWKALTSLEASTLRWAVMGPALVYTSSPDALDHPPSPAALVWMLTKQSGFDLLLMLARSVRLG